MKNLLVLPLLFFSFNVNAEITCSDYLHRLPLAPVFSANIAAEVYNGSVWAAERFVKSEKLTRTYEMSFLDLTMQRGQSPRYTYKDMLSFLLAENVEKGRVDVVRALLKSQHVDLNSNTMSTYSPLFQAISKGDLKMLRLLLRDDRLNVNYSPIFSMSTLAYAVSKGSVEVVELLLSEESLEINQVIREEIFVGEGRVVTQHPLVVAIQKNDKAIFDLLLKDIRTSPSGLQGSVTTPLIESTRSRNTYYKRRLLAYAGIDLSVRDSRGNDIGYYTRTKAAELELRVPLIPAD